MKHLVAGGAAAVVAVLAAMVVLGASHLPSEGPAKATAPAAKAGPVPAQPDAKPAPGPAAPADPRLTSGTGQTAPAAGPKAPNPGRTIRGKLTPPERVKGAMLWERAMNLKVPVSVDPKTGAFEVQNLRMGTYDMIIQTSWGRLEGIDMSPKVTDYDALIPPEYRTEDLGTPAPGSFSEDDRQAVRRIIYEVKRYENKIRDVYLVGSADKAVALMELAMDTDFHSRKGDEITWRIEQWYYEKNYDAWTTFRTRCLYRFRVSKAEWQRWGWQFEPALGGFDITVDRKEPVTVAFTIPDKPVPEKGLAGNQTPPAEKGIPKEPPPPEEGT